MDQIIWLISVPLVAGVLIYAAWILGGRKSPAGLGRIASIVAIVAVAWTLWEAIDLFRSLPPGGQGFWSREGAIELGPLSLALRFRADALSSLIVVAAGGIALLVTLYSFRAMADHDRAPVYYAWVLWTVSAVTAAALANTFLVLILAWEVATVLLYLLIGLGRPQSRAGAMKTFAILGFADLCLLMGVVLLFQAQGGVNSLLLMGGVLPQPTDGALPVVAYLLMLAAALAKAGAMPLHTWIPAASEHAPTTVFALLPAALDKLLGIYLLVRITFEVFAVNTYLAGVLMIIGAATILFAVMMAMVQHNLKRLLAFHAVSQVGYMVLGMGLAASILVASRAPGLTASQVATMQGVATIAFCGGLFHMLNNAIYKCALFLSAGSVERVTGTMDLDRLGGLARILPITFVCCLIAALSISGVPPMNGFVSKWLIYHGALGAGSGLATACLVVAVFGSVLTLASFIKVLHSVFLGTKGSAAPAGDERKENAPMAVAMVVLALACVFLGIWGGPAVDRLILPAAGAVGLQSMGIDTTGWALRLGGADATGLWAPSTASVLIVVGAVLGLLLYLYARAMRVRVVPNFVGGEDTSSDAIWHVSGTGFYETIRRLPALKWVFGDASAGAFDVYRLLGRYGDTVVQCLRGWHTGLVAAYASWVLIGLVVLVLALALG